MKEDEREVLAHMIQNIDEQEIFLEFIAKAETIKESWQIAKIFENKKKEFIENLQEYDSLIKDKERQLKIITAEIVDANNLLKDANDELDTIKAQLEDMRSKAQFYKTKIMQGKQSQSNESSDFQESFILQKEDNQTDMLDFEDMIQKFQPLSTVSVHIKNGATAMARVAQVVYSEDVYEVYQRVGKRLFRLKDRINELELTNKKLTIELRDLSEEDNFRENMQSKMITPENEDFQPISNTKLKTQNPNFKIQNMKTNAKSMGLEYNEDSEIDINLDIDLNKRMEKIDKKKEKVEEMFQQLNSFLRDDNLNLHNK
ncbi:nickel-binding protein Mua [Helicobacter didelphidarum]|nr:nickel-binding protein Mua [Helicobacter didelphidarum]